MIDLFSVDQVIAAEQAHAGELRSGALMQRASFALATVVARRLTALRGSTLGARVVILAGTGNNGGDALFAGALLAQRGLRVDVVGGEVMHVEGLRAVLAAGGRRHPIDDASSVIASADVIVDGLVGIGARGALREPFASLVPEVNEAEALIVAVDLPSGVDVDTGQVLGAAIRADVTVTFGAAKVGLFLAPARDLVGVLHVIDIGIDDALGSPVACALEGADVEAFMPFPADLDHKYRRGVVGVSAGSHAYPGAASLCMRGALAGDIGMVRYLDRADGVAGWLIATHPQIVRTDTVVDARCDAWVVGPGFAGHDDDAASLAAVLRSDVPVVLDAGALSVLARDADFRALVTQRRAVTVLTPHEGEFTRLGGSLEAGRLAGARQLARELGAIVLLKGPGSVVADPHGAVRIDHAGTAALATAGSGDVLAGLLGALLAGWHARAADDNPVDVIAAACWLHGTAGALAASTGRPVTAVEIADHLPDAVALIREA